MTPVHYVHIFLINVTCRFQQNNSCQQQNFRHEYLSHFSGSPRETLENAIPRCRGCAIVLESSINGIEVVALLRVQVVRPEEAVRGVIAGLL